jgi:RNA ligase (TIGR02306 family)
MRNLASVQRVIEVGPIEGADNIERIRVLGWQLVAKRGEFQPGDPCVYFEIDSLLPEWPVFEFMRAHKFRIRTVRMRGQISQGLAVPLSAFGDRLSPLGSDPAEGMDLTELLEVRKYEPPLDVSLGGVVRRSLPSFVPKTDEPRVQSAPGVIAEFSGVDVYVTVKCDGTSMTVYEREGDFGVCGRSLDFRLDVPEATLNTYVKVARELDLERKLAGRNLAIQGELCGPKIQKNRLALARHTLFVFNVYDIAGSRYLDFEPAREIVAELGLTSVPLVTTGPFRYGSVEELLEAARGHYEGTNHPREGIVIRTTRERYSEALQGRASFKVVNNDFLLKTGE